MTTDSEAIQRIAARLTMLTWAAIGAGGVAVAALLVAAFALSSARRHDTASPQPTASTPIEATEITLRDPDGNVAWTLDDAGLQPDRQERAGARQHERERQRRARTSRSSVAAAGCAP